MDLIDTKIPEVKLLEPTVYGDARGWFLENYVETRYQAAGVTARFVQDNVSLSQQGVLRGLHYQAAPFTQAKLVWVMRGAVWDVAVDIRKGSPTFGQYAAAELSDRNHRQLYIPRGFAHGFLVLEPETLFCYKCDNVYAPQADRGIRYDDPKIGIAWPEIGRPYVLSEKDTHHPALSEIAPWEE